MSRIRTLCLVALIALGAGACSEDRLTIGVESREAAPGEEICVPVYARRFENILTMQYSIGWDAKVLRFIRVSDFALPGMTDQNFGRPQDRADRLTVAWFEPNLAAVTIPDDEILFNVCFEVTGQPGDRSEVAVTGDPTIVEIANVREEVLSPALNQGSVSVR